MRTRWKVMALAVFASLSIGLFAIPRAAHGQIGET